MWRTVAVEIAEEIKIAGIREAKGEFAEADQTQAVLKAVRRLAVPDMVRSQGGRRLGERRTIATRKDKVPGKRQSAEAA
jgi:hypothetical protein